MNPWMHYFLLLGWALVLGLKGVPAWAAPGGGDTLFLKASNEGPWNHYFAYWRDLGTLAATGSEAARAWARGRFRRVPPGKVLQLGYTQTRVWLRATLVNTLPRRTRCVWSVYEHLDSAALYVQAGGRGQPRRVASTSGQQVASQRPFPARASCLPFWIAAHDTAVVYLWVEDHSGAVYLPTDLTTVEDFLSYEIHYSADSHWAWLLGLYLASALFSLMLWAFLHDRIYLWYAAYVVFAAWFLLAEDLLTALLLPPGPYALGCALGQFTLLLLALAAGLQVMALFLHLRAGWPRLHRGCAALSGAAGALALLYPLACGPALRAGPGWLALLNGSREALLWALLLTGAGVLTVVGLRGRPPQRRLAGLYALAYAFFFLGAVQFLPNRSGLTTLHLMEPNALAWGLVLELGVLSVLLTGRFRHAYRQNARLRLRQLHEREAAAQRLIQAQDAEREALARELHDSLAPGLTALHLAWQGRLVRQELAQAAPLLQEAHRRTEALLHQLRREVRALSQVLQPPPPGQPLPLPQAIGLLVQALGLDDDGPQINYTCDPATAALPPPLQEAAYRLVAELLHNALRHAQARTIAVAIRRLPLSLLLTVTDDGRGFDPQAPAANGSGLRGLQARVRYLRGRAMVQSQPGQGTAVTVALPV